MYLLIKLQSNYVFRLNKETSKDAASPNAARDGVETGHGLETKPTDSLDSVNQAQVSFICSSEKKKAYDCIGWKMK